MMRENEQLTQSRRTIPSCGSGGGSSKHSPASLVGVTAGGASTARHSTPEIKELAGDELLDKKSKEQIFGVDLQKCATDGVRSGDEIRY